MATSRKVPEPEKVLFRLHPRVFAALGMGLVTNDIVAIIELVKNSYDAFASQVDVRLMANDAGRVSIIEVQDDGEGMSDDLIRDVWCEVATPYRTIEPLRKHGRVRRRVSGEKGLGRLSAGRLGNWLEMLTQAKGHPCWQVLVDWTGLAESKSLASCFVELSEYSAPSPFKESGTLLRIEEINGRWEEKDFDQLEKNLSRLVSPFANLKDFSISLTTPQKEDSGSRTVQIETPDYLDRPPYRLSGSVDTNGKADFQYTYSMPPAKRPVTQTVQLTSTNFEEQRQRNKESKTKKSLTTLCGPFEFEIRAWDIGAEALQDYAGRLNLQHTAARISKDIRTHSGISLYRDHILVLPKSDKVRDWLGLDLRRISRVGHRLATNQIIGYVLISANDNASIQDTSDRERLVENEASAEFQELIQQVVAFVEDERAKDRLGAGHKEPPFKDLFAELRAPEAIDAIQKGIEKGDPPSKLLPLVRRHSEQLQKTADQLEQRIVYYSRLASLGSMAGFIVHEVRNHTSSINLLIQSARHFLANSSDHTALERLEADLQLGGRALGALVSIADHFAPLASRASKTKKHQTVLEEAIDNVLENRKGFLDKHGITFNRLTSKTCVAIDPGELFTAIFNLVDNAIYWLVNAQREERKIKFRITKLAEGSRAKLEIHDSGPGVEEGYEERIFWPGVTRKREGIGMGLTVASEIVSQYDGKMQLIQPGNLGGASFAFDLPVCDPSK
jgi:signal transduction histidine kinase